MCTNKIQALHDLVPCNFRGNMFPLDVNKQLRLLGRLVVLVAAVIADVVVVRRVHHHDRRGYLGQPLPGIQRV